MIQAMHLSGILEVPRGNTGGGTAAFEGDNFSKNDCSSCSFVGGGSGLVSKTQAKHVGDVKKAWREGVETPRDLKTARSLVPSIM
mmetsp:Transcript_21596/g.53290  ORF Transcript_21596/g.53290 Transcript_21596/m.53290 type:complete len:85 (-) Transcript_21596:32-286(-)